MAQNTDSISLEDDDRLFVDDVSCFNPSDVKLPADETLDDEDGEEEDDDYGKEEDDEFDLDKEFEEFDEFMSSKSSMNSSIYKCNVNSTSTLDTL